MPNKMDAIKKKVEKKEKLTFAEFALYFIDQKRDIEKSKGINTVASGFNDACKAYFGTDIENLEADIENVGHYTGVMALPETLKKQGVIDVRPVRGMKGVMIYAKGDLSSNRTANNGAKLLTEMGLS